MEQDRSLYYKVEALPDDPQLAYEYLFDVFDRDGRPSPDELNFVLFSTSGIHGSYLTIEEVEDGETVTVLVIKPRMVHMNYGNVVVTKENREWLIKLRNRSKIAMLAIGDSPNRTKTECN